MKMVKKLSLLAMAIVIVGCNEKVSPELQQGNATTPDDDGDGPTIVPDEYFIKVNNTSPTILNYKLHKTGAGNFNKPCEVRSTTKLSNEMYQASPAANDITCFFEAEELSLYYGGLSFQVESSPNTCEYIAYSPFSYYNFQPGASFGTYLELVKGNDDTNASHLSDLSTRAALTAAGVDLSWEPRSGGGAIDLAFGETISETIDDADRQAFETFDSDQKFCRFNYQVQRDEPNAPNCDEGTVTVKKLTVTFDTGKADAAATAAGDAAGDAARTATENTWTTTYSTAAAGPAPNDGTATITAAEASDITARGDAAYSTAYTTAYNTAYAAWDATFTIVPRTIKCGGKITACVDGPIKKHSGLKGPRGTLYTQTTYDQPGKTEKFEYGTLFPSRIGTMVYANYRRDLANPFIAYGATDENDPVYTGAFASVLYGKDFQPNLMERYSRNQNWDKSTMVTGAMIDDASIRFGMWTALPYAAEPFVGLAFESYTNPYYTFYCLNAAYDIKARIRMVVRDWDRLNTNDETLEFLSDIGTINARMDVNSADVEDPDSADDLNAFNDELDWDDYVILQRNPVFPYIYRPLPVPDSDPFGFEIGYPEGYFNPIYFPEEIQD